MNLYIPASDVRRGDVVLKRYVEMRVFETYETRRGTVALCVQAPWGQHEYRHRPATKVLVRREDCS